MPRVADRVIEPPSGELLPKFVASLDPEWMEEAFAATIRRRRLPAEQVVWLVIGMCLFRDLSMRELVATLDLALPGSRGIRVAPSSIVQARELKSQLRCRLVLTNKRRSAATPDQIRSLWTELALPRCPACHALRRSGKPQPART